MGGNDDFHMTAILNISSSFLVSYEVATNAGNTWNKRGDW